jgi:hypothetical protein
MFHGVKTSLSPKISPAKALVRFSLWSRSGSGSAGELDLSGLKQEFGRLPHFVSDAG